MWEMDKLVIPGKHFLFLVHLKYTVLPFPFFSSMLVIVHSAAHDKNPLEVYFSNVMFGLIWFMLV